MMADQPTARQGEALPTPSTRTESDRALPPATGTPPPVRGNGRPSDPAELRREIDRTRDRMSDTLDAIEDRLIEQKEAIWAKATLQGFRRTISTEPWRSMAIAFAAGYIIAAIRD